jgi:hypothetical protein
MKRLCLHSIALAVLFGLMASVVGQPVRAQKPTKTITGVVKRYEDARGNLRSVFIVDSDKNEFLVVRSTKKGKEVLGQVGAIVEATGYVKKSRDTNFALVIDVLEYKIVTPSRASSAEAHESPPEDE